jgi:hypothetical protein
MRLAAHRAPHRAEGRSDGHLSGRFARERDGSCPHRGGDTTFFLRRALFDNCIGRSRATTHASRPIQEASWPDLFRPSTPPQNRNQKNVDGRDKPGHDE